MVHCLLQLYVQHDLPVLWGPWKLESEDITLQHHCNLILSLHWNLHQDRPSHRLQICSGHLLDPESSCRAPTNVRKRDNTIGTDGDTSKTRSMVWSHIVRFGVWLDCRPCNTIVDCCWGCREICECYSYQTSYQTGLRPLSRADQHTRKS